MKTTQYVRQEKAITTADTSGIRERWLWGLRLLRDTEAMASASSLRHGVAAQLISAAGKDSQGRNRLGEQEIQRRLRCARAYSTEYQIRAALTDFGTWDELARAGFPEYEVPEGESVADHRTDSERERDRQRAFEDILDDQGALFPLSDYEPSTATLKELIEYADEMEGWTSRRVNHDRKRREYLEALTLAVDDDLSVTWLEAHRRRNGGAA